MVRVLGIEAKAPLGKGMLCAQFDVALPPTKRECFLVCRFDDADVICDSLPELVQVAHDRRLSLDVEISKALIDYSKVFCAILFGNSSGVIGGAYFRTPQACEWLARKTCVRPEFPRISDNKMVFMTAIMEDFDEGRYVNQLHEVTVSLVTLESAVSPKGEKFMQPKPPF